MTENHKLGLRQVAKSVGAAFLGVQSNANRVRDFTVGRPRDFILMGLVFTVLFILIVWGVVSLVLSLTT